MDDRAYNTGERGSRLWGPIEASKFSIPSTAALVLWSARLACATDRSREFRDSRMPESYRSFDGDAHSVGMI